MKSRCNNNRNPAYINYGGRGITVCNEWNSSYDIFKQWAMDNGYSDNLTIDRIDNNKLDRGYSPENCRFVGNKDQANNKRNNRTITFKGQTLNVNEWAAFLGITGSTLRSRLNRQG